MMVIMWNHNKKIPTSGGVVALKIGRRQVPDSNPGRACRPSRSFGVFRGFLQNLRKYGLRSLRKTPTEGTIPVGPGPTSEQLALHLQPTIIRKNHLMNYKMSSCLQLVRTSTGIQPCKFQEKIERQICNSCMILLNIYNNFGSVYIYGYIYIYICY